MDSGAEECPRRGSQSTGNFVPYMCPRGNQYNDLATLFFNTQARGCQQGEQKLRARVPAARSRAPARRQPPARARRTLPTKHIATKDPPDQPTNQPTNPPATPQDDAIRNLFSSRTKAEYSVTTLVVFTTTFYLLSLVTYGMAIPTGLFVPGILCGASYGRLVGVFVADLHPAQKVDEVGAGAACGLMGNTGGVPAAFARPCGVWVRRRF